MDNMYGMLWRIPTMISFSVVDEVEVQEDEEEEYDNDEYFHSISSQLIKYEHVQDVAPLLELAFWKMKILQHSYSYYLLGNNENDVKLMCRTYSLSMFKAFF